MAEAFKEAATRHWSDAKLLEEQGRRANADQLVGFAAECAIKTALCELPAFAPEGELNQYYRAHINELWPRVHVQALQRRYPTLAALLRTPNPFDDWSVAHRYAPDGAVTQVASQRHRDMAKRLLGIVGITGTRREQT